MAKEIHIRLTEKSAREIEELMNKMGFTSMSDVIRSSIALQKFLVEEETKNDKELILRDKKTKKEQRFVSTG